MLGKQPEETQERILKRYRVIIQEDKNSSRGRCAIREHHSETMFGGSRRHTLERKGVADSEKLTLANE